MTDFYSFDPAAGHGLPHDPIKAIIAPRPIGWMSTLSVDGTPNLAPYSFFNIFCGAPPILAFGSEGRKDSLTNIEATGEFVFNLATARQSTQMNQSSGVYPAHIDEFEAAGLEKTASERVAPFRVAGAPAAMECRALEIKQLRDLDGNALKVHMIIGQVVRVHIDRAYLVDGLFDMTRAGTIARCGYRGDYAEVTTLFDMRRPDIGGQ